MFTPILSQTLVFLLLIALGYTLLKFKCIPDNTDKAVSLLEKNIFLPAWDNSVGIMTNVRKAITQGKTNIFLLHLLGKSKNEREPPFNLALFIFNGLPFFDQSKTNPYLPYLYGKRIVKANSMLIISVVKLFRFGFVFFLYTLNGDIGKQINTATAISANIFQANLIHIMSFRA